MNKQQYLVLALCCAFIGIFLSAYFNEWIIIRHPLYSRMHVTSGELNGISTKKKVALIFWRQGKWIHEAQEIIWPHATTNAVHYLVNAWLTLLDEDAVMDKKVTLQTAILSASGSTLYLSFDRTPLSVEASTFASWMWVEGLFKTLRENGIIVQSIQLLVHHQPLLEDHLDFSNPWPAQGFLADH